MKAPKMLSKAAIKTNGDAEDQIVRDCYEVAIRSLCPETWEKFCEAIRELCERRNMDTAFMGKNAQASETPKVHGLDEATRVVDRFLELEERYQENQANYQNPPPFPRRPDSDTLLVCRVFKALATALNADEVPAPPGFSYATSADLMRELGSQNPEKDGAVLDGIASGKVVELPKRARPTDGGKGV